MPSVFDIGSLGTSGFTATGDDTTDLAGGSVSGIGDINGDGYEDFVVGATQNADGGLNAGSAYVVFGHGGAFPALDLGALTPTQGFQIVGENFQGRLGWSVAGAGDFNGDGYDDFIVAAPFSSEAGSAAGAVYLLYGHAGAFSTVDLTTMTASTGTVILGDLTGDQLGRSVSGGGDFNGDGFDDIVIGALGADPHGNLSGNAYILFGNASPSATIDPGTLTLSQGFRLQGGAAYDYTGFSVANAGDVNGDGFDDMLVTAVGPNSYAGGAYLLFGHAGGSTTVDLATMTPDEGVMLRGDHAGDRARTVAAAGDVNGDGFDDFLVGADGFDNYFGDIGAVYLVFGKADGWTTGTLQTYVASQSAMLITGNNAADATGQALAAGDINGDGFTDVIIGVARGDLNGLDSGTVYVLYGSATGVSSPQLSSIPASSGFVLVGDVAGDYAGKAVSVVDVNGDGFDDIIIGAPYADDAGASAGEADVFFGRAPTTSVTRIGSAAGQTLAGGAGDDTLDARDGDDRLLGHAGDDHLLGGAGNDAIDGGADDDVIDGGSGNDTILGGDGDDNVTAGSGADSVDGGTGDDVLLGGSSDDLLKGATGTDNLNGGSGNDDLDGGAGADVMTGGSGDDTYHVDSTADRLFEDDDSGHDRVFSSVTVTLAGQYIEDATLTGTAAIGVTGNSLDNVLTGNSGANVLGGGDGNDTLDGMAGADTMGGGKGNDIFYVDNSADLVVEADGAGTDQVFSTATFSLAGQYVENLTLTGAGAINGTGNALANTILGNGAANTLVGGDGNDTLNGGGGADVLRGGAGDDILIVDNVGDTVLELANEGADTVQSSVTFALGGQYIERLILTGSANINGTGTSQDNEIDGNSGNNTLNGGGGNDALYGGAGTDTLIGGTGLDSFYFTASLATMGVDNINDFSVADDTIYLAQSVFAAIAAGGLAAGAFKVGTAATDADDRIIYNSATGNLFYDADGTGAGAMVQFAHVTAGTALTAADFVVF